MPRFLPIVLLVACGAPTPSPVEPDPTEAVAIAAVTQPVAARPEFVGVVTSRSSKVIVAPFEGRIDRLTVHLNQRVRAGDPIAKLDETELQSKFAAASATEQAARAEAGALGATAGALQQRLRIDQRLVRAGVAARQSARSSAAEFASAAANTGAASGRAKAARFQRDELAALLAQAQIVAPIDGVIQVVKVKEGEMAPKGTPIARVFDPRDLMIRFAVPREYRNALVEGQRVELKLADVTRPVYATIERISGELEPPINFTVVEADIDDSKLNPDEIRVASEGRVRLIDKTPAAPPAGANR